MIFSRDFVDLNVKQICQIGIQKKSIKILNLKNILNFAMEREMILYQLKKLKTIAKKNY
jgi:hypothetical protein